MFRMKRTHLLQIADKLATYRKINAIERVEDTIIKIVFDHDEVYYFDMKRGDAYIFQKTSYKKVRQYNAPFDIVLKKRFNNAKVEKVEVLKSNRILRIDVNSSSKYKAQKTILQFEFTGRNTNIIILNEDEIILEAYRHIDIHTSFREVKVGVKLLPLPPREFKEKNESIECLSTFLRDEYLKREEIKLKALKKSKEQIVLKRLKKLKNILDKIEDESFLIQKSQRLTEDGNLLLSNLHLMKNYQKEITLNDYEGNKRTIVLPSHTKTPAQAANELFKRAKKLKQKAKFAHIERENITTKITFLENLQKAINHAKSIDELSLYLPKQAKLQKNRAKTDANIETFFIEGYKIRVGKNEKGNISLLKSAKMSDIWMHLKDMPSTHVIITNEKKMLPTSVLEFGAKLCVQFSAISSGSYLVDFTQRRNVKMREGANVNYVNYDTIKVFKD